MDPNRERWIAAGGEAFRLDLYATIGQVAPFAQGSSRALASIHPDLPERGCIGDWVGEPAVLHAAEAWLADRGCREVHGPKELCAWFNSRAALGPFDQPAFAWEPITPAQPWLDAGYTPLRRYVSVVADHTEQIAAGRAAASSLFAQGWRVTALPADAEGHIPEGLFHESLAMVHDLFSSGFQEVDGFARVPLHALRAYYGRYRTELDPRLTLVALDPEGVPGGAILAVPDTAAPDRGWFQVMALAVRPELRQRGVGSWLVASCHKAARSAGYKAGVHALIAVEGSDEHTWYRGKVFRRYALLGKTL